MMWRAVPLILWLLVSFAPAYTLPDFADFASEWLTCRRLGYSPAWDLDRNGCVDLTDLTFFAERWLEPMSLPEYVIITGITKPEYQPLNGVVCKKFTNDVYIGTKNVIIGGYGQALPKIIIADNMFNLGCVAQNTFIAFFVKIDTTTPVGQYTELSENPTTATVLAYQAALTEPAPKSLVSLEQAKAYLGIVGSDKDAQITAMIDAATCEIERYCQRSFALARRNETYDGTGTAELQLRHYPVQSVELFSIGAEGVFNIIYSGDDNYSAEAIITHTALILQIIGGEKHGQVALPYSDYKNIGALVGAVNNLMIGWTAWLTGEKFGAMDSSYLAFCPMMYTCNKSAQTVYAPAQNETYYSLDSRAGILKAWRTIPADTQNVFVRYISGYDPIPADLQQICLDLIKYYHDKTTVNPLVQSERIGDYSYTNRTDAGAASVDAAGLPKDIRGRLDKWKRWTV